MMKTLTKTSFIIIILVISFIFSACNPFDNTSGDYLTKKMDEISIEFEGYEIVKTTAQDTMVGFEGNATINEEPIQISRNGGEEYVIQFRNKTIAINDDFMRENCRAYVEIHSIWINYYSKTTQGTNESSRIYGVFVYDNNLFIITNGLRNSLSQYDCAWKYPITLYLYNFESGNVLYAGYYSDFRKDVTSLKVLKKENT